RGCSSWRCLLTGVASYSHALFLFRVFLARFEGLVEPFVGLLGKLLLILLVIRQASLLAIQQVLVGHRIIISRIYRQCFVEVGEAFIDKLSLLVFRRRIVLVVHDDPVHAADGIIRNRILRVQLGILHVVVVSLLELVRILVNARETGYSVHIVRIASQHVV